MYNKSSNNDTKMQNEHVIDRIESTGQMNTCETIIIEISTFRLPLYHVIEMLRQPTKFFDLGRKE